MPILSEEMRDFLAEEYADRAAFISLHDGSPGTDGSNEVDGSGYTRQAPSWGAASGGQVQATMVFDLPTSSITHVGVWNSAEDVFLDSYELTSPVPISAPGQRTVVVTYTQN